MNVMKNIFCLVVINAIGCSAASAGDMDLITNLHGFRPVFSLQGGYASMNAGGNTRQFGGTDTDIFTYASSSKTKSTGFIGMFVGAEHALPWIAQPDLMVQTGVEYNSFGNMNVKGINTVGIADDTQTTYNYHYTYQTQQVLGLLKLLVTTYERFHFYGEIGLGAAINQLQHYNATTIDTGSLNLTPAFSNRSQTQFSYSVGLGVEADLTKNVRFGIGYRYSNFGAPSLGNGAVTFGNYSAPVPFTLSNSTSYTNQFIARISYLI